MSACPPAIQPPVNPLPQLLSSAQAALGPLQALAAAIPALASAAPFVGLVGQLAIAIVPVAEEIIAIISQPNVGTDAFNDPALNDQLQNEIKDET